MSSKTCNLGEIQGLLASGYAKQRAMCCRLLKITDATSARQWLSSLVPHITFCGDRASAWKLNVAFTFAGLEQLASADWLHHFSREFREGMVTPHRQRALGDLPGSADDPIGWSWGGPSTDSIHVLLLIYALNNPELDFHLQQLELQFAGVELIADLRSTPLLEDKEHFGFCDGFGQPWAAELHEAGCDRDRVALGELVLGYKDNSGAQEPAPELAYDGSYLVLRQLVQRVPEFWGAFSGLADDEKIRRAAKLVGRWPDGTPLTLSPLAPDPSVSKNDFDFAKLDASGAACPLGAHIRRTNPRDVLVDDPTQSLQEVNRHRILRRGRAFGLPAPASVYPAGVTVHADPDATGDPNTRGLLFMCLNASLSRQFEFCQQSWINNPKFLGLSAETDPIASPIQWSGPEQEPTFTVQAAPLHVRYREREKYIHSIGGGYFLLPGRTAIRRLSGSD